LNCSAPHQNGEVVNRRNHLRFEEDDQFNGDSTAAFRMIEEEKRQALGDRNNPFAKMGLELVR
jgi:hypothetical protein